MRRSISVLLKIVLGVAILIWLTSSDRLSFQVLAAARLDLILLLLLPVLFLNLLAQAVRWWYLLKIHGVSMSIRMCVKYAWIGNFFAIVLPGAVGNELARAYYMWRDDSNLRTARMLSVFLDRFLGLIVFFAMGGVTFIHLLATGGGNGVVRSLGWISIVVVGSSVAAVLLVALPSIRSMIGRWLPGRRVATLLTEAVQAYARHPWRALLALLCSVLAAIALMFGFASAAWALGERVDSATILLTVPYVVTANTLPLSPGGLGIGELTTSAIFASRGFSGGAEVMLLVRLVLTLVRLPGFFFYLTHRSPVANGEEDQDE